MWWIIVLSFVGSTGSTTISFILPGLFFWKVSFINIRTFRSAHLSYSADPGWRKREQDTQPGRPCTRSLWWSHFHILVSLNCLVALTHISQLQLSSMANARLPQPEFQHLPSRAQDWPIVLERSAVDAADSSLLMRYVHNTTFYMIFSVDCGSWALRSYQFLYSNSTN